ncbi:MAG TPA: glutathione S-transferase family protein [Polyangiaceae bacterium]
MAIVFYSAPMSSASPVAAALAELEVPHETVTLNLSSGDQRKPEYLALNPNGKVPTLVVDGTPMFEALAIMQWLGDRFGVSKGLWPAADSPARMQAMAWSTWAYVTYGTALVLHQLATSERVDKALHNSAQAEFARKDLNRLLGLLDARLAKQAHLLGAEYSLADLIVASVVGYGVFSGIAVDAHSHVKSWLERFQARESFRTTMPG